MISINAYFETWLCYAALSGLVILAVGSLAVWLAKEPIHKVRIIQWTFLACLAVPLVQAFGLTPGYQMNLPVASTESSLASSDDVELSPRVSVAELQNERDFDDREAALMAHRDSTATGAADFGQSPVGPTKVMNNESAADSAVAAFDFTNVLKLAYCTFVAIFAVWWSIGLLFRRRIVGQSELASDEVHEVLKSIAGDRASSIRLLTNEQIKSPVMWGLFRPTIVIPLSHVNDPQALRWGLAHEWSHVERRDFSTRMLAMGTNLVCFFQPCFWWLNRELAFSQDLLADSFAAKHGYADEYAAFLMNLSRQKNTRLVPVGLGIAEGRSVLFRRIRNLLASSRPPVQKIGRITAMLIAILSIATIACLGAVRIGADVNADGVQASNEVQVAEEPKVLEPKAEKTATDEKPTVHYGIVVDAKTSLPISGAKVHIKRELSRDPKTGKWILLEQTEHVTNIFGAYSFSLSAEQVAEPSLYLEVKTEHPDYQPKGWGGYSYRMIQTNMKKGDLPWFTKIDLHPGEEVFGTVSDADGNPIEGVLVSSFSKDLPKDDGDKSFRGTLQEVVTDAKGFFRLMIPTPGDGVLWVHPKDWAPQAHRIGDRRGDFGVLKMQEGVRLSGQVLDMDGKPIPNVALNLRRDGDGAKADEFLNANHAANGIGAGTMTDADGRFTSSPLVPGAYNVEVSENVRDPTAIVDNWFDRKGKEKLKHVFPRRKIEITDEPIESMVVKAIPHVTIRGQWVDSKGNPRSGHDARFHGKFGGTFWFTQSSDPGSDGKFDIVVPKGITEARMQLITNEHSALRWKFSDMEQHAFGDVDFPGTIDADIEGFEIVKYKAPILLVRVEDKDGKPVRDFERLYGAQIGEGIKVARAGATSKRTPFSSVSFDRQSDGRWRSSQMLPDIELSLQPKAKVPQGAAEQPLAEKQVVTLKEGETREIKFVIEK